MEIINESSFKLASRWSRIGASLIDSLILLVFLAPAMYFSGAFEGISNTPPTQPTLLYQLLIALLGFTLYAAINWKYLKYSGQTVGKKALGIKIINIDGSQPSVNVLLFKRYTFYIFVPYIPFVGGIISLIGLLMIFGKQKRVLHDRVAKTQVIVS